MTQQLRGFLLFEALAFTAAALVHFGVLVDGYEHDGARIPESVIALVLFAGLILTWIRPDDIRGIALAAQGFALFGTFVGLFTIAIGVGPRTAPDITYHVLIVAVLVWGLAQAWQMPARTARA